MIFQIVPKIPANAKIYLKKEGQNLTPLILCLIAIINDRINVIAPNIYQFIISLIKGKLQTLSHPRLIYLLDL